MNNLNYPLILITIAMLCAGGYWYKANQRTTCYYVETDGNKMRQIMMGILSYRNDAGKWPENILQLKCFIDSDFPEKMWTSTETKNEFTIYFDRLNKYNDVTDKGLGNEIIIISDNPKRNYKCYGDGHFTVTPVK